MARALAEISRVPGVTAVISPFSRLGASQVSHDGRTAYATIVYGAVRAGEYTVPASEVASVQRIAAAARTSGLSVELGGQAFTPTPGASGTEVVGIIAALLILLLMFRSLWAAVLPVLTGIAGVGTASLVVILLSHVVSLPSTTPTMGALIGLGVGIDYALFIVNRHRQESWRARPWRTRARRASAPSGRAVVFAGVTVIIALLGMRLLGMSILSGMVLGAAMTVATTVLAAITLLPAVLGMLGPRVLSRGSSGQLTSSRARARFGLGEPTVPGTAVLAGSRVQKGWWARWARAVAARPAILGVVALGLMAALAIPA